MTAAPDFVGRPAEDVEPERADRQTRAALPETARLADAGLVAPEGVLALQRTAGNAAVSRMLAGRVSAGVSAGRPAILARQGTPGGPKLAPGSGPAPPKSSAPVTLPPSLRVRIVAHASPRWRSAQTAKEADEANQKLSLQRAQTVKAVVDAELRETIGQNAKIDYDVSYEPGDEPEGTVAVSSEGHGSRDTLKQAEGNRSANDEHQRRVEVYVERIDRAEEQAGRSTPASKRTVMTRMWWINVDSSNSASLGGAATLLAMTLTNSETGRSASVYVPGLGGGTPGVSASKSVGGDPVSFWTDEPMGFSDFENTPVQYESSSVGVVFAGYERARLSFATLGPIAQDLDVSGWNVGAQIKLGYGVSAGPLKFFGGTPPSDDYVDPPSQDSVPYTRRQTSGELHWALFDTQKSTLSGKEHEHLTAFVIDMGYRFRDETP